MAVTAKANMPTTPQPYLQNYLSKKVLENFEPNLLFWQMGERPMVQEGYGTYVWARPSQLTVSAAGATLTEGTPPLSTNFTYTTVAVTPTQYGIYVEISDRLMKAAPTKILNDAATEVGNNMARIIDNVIQTSVMAGTNVIYQGAAANRAALGAGNTITSDDIARAVGKLRVNNATPWDANGNFVAMMHTNVATDLRRQPNGAWVEFSKYVTPEKLFNGETGRLHGARIVESANIQTFTSTVTVYPTLFVGKMSYGVAEFSSLETIYNPAGGSADPLRQKVSVGAKVDFAATILRQEGLVRLETAAVAY